jgi:hypothetical protein
VVLDADPNARPFYERMGAVVVGGKDPITVTGRRSPHRRFEHANRWPELVMGARTKTTKRGSR